MSIIPEPTDEELAMARQLVEHVKTVYVPRVRVLEDRIAAALGYMDMLANPNVNALSHIRRFLTGEDGGMSALFKQDDPADACVLCGDTSFLAYARELPAQPVLCIACHTKLDTEQHRASHPCTDDCSLATTHDGLCAPGKEVTA